MGILPKPSLTPEQVNEFLHTHVGHEVANIQEVKDGYRSHVSFFSCGKTQYVLRVSDSREGYEKDKSAFEHFHSSCLPIPQVVEIGDFDVDHSFAISKRMPGVPSTKLRGKAILTLLPQLFQILDQIHQIDITDTPGFAEFDNAGIGEAGNWQRHVLSTLDDEWLDFPSLFARGALNQEFVQVVYRRIEQLAVFCSEERRLVHGDFSTNNILSNGERITAVLDWSDAMYGDFLYDIASLSFWSGKHSFADLYGRYYRNKHRPIPDLEHRVACYEALIGLRSTAFFANLGTRYEITRDWARDRTLALIDHTPE